MQEPAKASAPAADRVARERVVGKTRQEARQGDLRLEPREVQARAGMDAESEGDVAVGLTARSRRSGSGNCAGSRFAAPMPMVMRDSGGRSIPPTTIA